MPPAIYVVLDASTIAGVTLADDEHAQRAYTRIAVAKKKGVQFLLSGTGLTELAATYRSEAKFERLLKTARSLCSGALPTGAEEVIQIELTEPDPYTSITARPPVSLDGVEAAVEEAEVKKFYEQGAFRNQDLKHLLEALDPVAKTMRKLMPSSFIEYAEGRRATAFHDILKVSKDRGHIASIPDDLQALWERAYGWRFLVLVSLANEFRRLTRSQTKGEGSLSDLRMCIEAAYSHELWTTDKELVGCGELANRVVRRPKVVFWDPRA